MRNLHRRVLIVTRLGALLGLVILPLVARLAAEELPPALSSLVEAERSFARMSVEKGIRDSFLAFLAEDGIVFRPHPVVFREDVLKHPAPATPPPVTLDWAPAWADVSAAGDLGYNTGPFVLIDRGPKKNPPQRGYFFSIWKKQPDGAWKVVLDAGVQTENAPEVSAVKLQAAPAAGSAAGSEAPGAEAARNAMAGIAEAEKRLAQDLAERGTQAAYAARLGAEARMNRNGTGQLAGAEAIKAHLAKQEGKLALEPPLKTDVARSADLAYTYGRYQRMKPGVDKPLETGYYVHVWRRAPGGDWKLVFDTESPVPAA
jgi:ketosteroid isomerase-like protein